jgi:hypothetical protein
MADSASDERRPLNHGSSYALGVIRLHQKSQAITIADPVVL